LHSEVALCDRIQAAQIFQAFLAGGGNIDEQVDLG
jgi:hypothetical protein